MAAKPVYMAKSLEELNKKAVSARFKQATPKALCKASESLYLKGKDGLLAGDQEQSYVMFMRFLEACNCIKKSKEYRLKKAEFDKFLPVVKVEFALKHASELSDALRERYSALREEDEEAAKTQVTKHVTSGDQEDQVVPQISTPLIPSSSPLPSSSSSSSPRPHLSPQQLYAWLTRSPEDVMVLDCRPRAEFLACHPDSKRLPQWLCVPEETVLKGLTPAGAEAFLSATGRTVWRDRCQRSCIVLVDDHSTMEQLRSHSDAPILALKDAIFKWENRVKAEPLVLEGGFARWHLAYSPLCLGAYHRRQEGGGASQPTALLEYPTMLEKEEEEESEVSTAEDPSPTVTAAPVETDTSQASEPSPLREPAWQTPFTPLPVVTPPTLLYAPPPPLPLPIPVDLFLEGEAVLSSVDDPLPTYTPLGEDRHSNQQSEQVRQIYQPDQVQQLYQQTEQAQQVYQQPEQAQQVYQQTEQAQQVYQQPEQLRQVYLQPEAHLQQEVSPQTAVVHGHPAFQQSHHQHRALEQGNPPNNQGGIPFTQPPAQLYEPRPPPQTNEQGRPPLQSNPRVAYGSAPLPPHYDNAVHLPSYTPVQPPLPPPTVIHPHHPPHLHTPSQHQPLVTPPHTIIPELQNKLSEKDARIEALQRKLTERDRESHAREEERQRYLEEMKQGLQVEKQKLEQEAQSKIHSYEQINLHERGELERQQRELDAARQQHRMEVEKAARNLQQSREEVQKEKAMVAATQQHLALRAQQQQQQQGGRQALALQDGVPPGWEKRLDSATGRFYYVDHSSKTTHWSPPTNWINYQEAEAQRLRASQSGTTTPSVQPSSAPSQQQQQQHQPGPAPPSGPAPQPAVDRSSKPAAPTVDRSSKPAFVPQELPVEVRRRKMLALQAEGRATDTHMVNAMTGLRNLGNTCFMNSILQCLCSTTPLVQYFTSGRYQEHINYRNPLGSKGAVAMEFAFLVETMWSSRYRVLSPREFKGRMEVVWRDMGGGGQHDGQEFLAVILDRLHEDLNRVKETRVQTPPDSSASDQELAAVAWQRHLEHNNSIIVKCFQGMLRSSIECGQCKQRSVSFEPFMYLSLPLPLSNKPTSLEECVKLFTKPEYVDWLCPGCHGNIQAVKRLTLWKLPPIVLFHIKRFQHDGMWKDKKQNHLHFPTRERELDLTAFVAGEKPRLFTLYGVCNHYGTLEGGHYTAFCKNPNSGKFHLFDDQVIRDAAPRDITGPAAYLLFYSSVDLSPARMLLR